MKHVAVALFLAALPALGENVITRCATETKTLTLTGSSGIPVTWDVRRIVHCGEDVTENALWHLDRLDSPDGTLDGRFVRTRARALVYVLDTGIESNHDEFADGNVIGGIDISGGASSASDPCSKSNDSPVHPCLSPTFASLAVGTHGSGVASAVAGRNVGVAPGAWLVAVRIQSSDDKQWLAAFDAVIKHAWDPSTPQVQTAIVNMSSQLGAATPQTASTHTKIAQKIRDMVYGVDASGNRDPSGKHFFFTIAAGNAATPEKDGADRGQCGPNYEVKLFPASIGPTIDGVVTVGGITMDDKIWSDTCRGDAVELLAPAESVLVASPTGPFDYRSSLASGTSWSAPIAAGAAAWLLTIHPELTPAELEEILESSATTIAGGPPGTENRHVVSVMNGVTHRRAARH